MAERGKLLILSGPSGAGKSTVIAELMKLLGGDKLCFSVSATTRAPRPGEIEGKDYFFVSREAFDDMAAKDELLEHAEFVGNCYGTPKAPVVEQMERGNTVVLDIEVQGAAQVKKLMPEAVSVFLMPPSLEELEARLRGRGTESEEKILSRLAQARRDMPLADTYDFKVINDVPQRAAEELRGILDAWNK